VLGDFISIPLSDIGGFSKFLFMVKTIMATMMPRAKLTCYAMFDNELWASEKKPTGIAKQGNRINSCRAVVFVER
jgi:hypothetical protein